MLVDFCYLHAGNSEGRDNKNVRFLFVLHPFEYVKKAQNFLKCIPTPMFWQSSEM